MAPSWRDLVDLVNSAERSLATGGSSKVRWDAAHQLIDSLPHPRNPPEELNRRVEAAPQGKHAASCAAPMQGVG